MRHHVWPRHRPLTVSWRRCSLVGLHRRRRAWLHSFSDGSFAALWANGNQVGGDALGKSSLVARIYQRARSLSDTSSNLLAGSRKSQLLALLYPPFHFITTLKGEPHRRHLKSQILAHNSLRQRYQESADVQL